MMRVGEKKVAPLESNLEWRIEKETVGNREEKKKRRKKSVGPNAINLVKFKAGDFLSSWPVSLYKGGEDV
jgi:hypothetical protein